MRDFQRPRRSAAFGASGMAATSHPDATLAALDILKRGGNAMDAAIGAVALLGVVEPHMTGIGGDCFVLYAPAGGTKDGPVIAFNGSGAAPAAATVEKLRGLGVTEIGEDMPHAVTIPGAVDAWCRLHGDHGKLPLAEILAPAIAAAENGMLLHPRVARDWARQRRPPARQRHGAGSVPARRRCTGGRRPPPPAAIGGHAAPHRQGRPGGLL